jgi:hypothetical protein
VYCYNDAGAFDIPSIKNGNLNPGVENPGGSLLSKEQVDRLLKTLNTKRFEAGEPGCFVPRHAFVFYDGHLEHRGKHAHANSGIVELCVRLRQPLTNATSCR